MAEWAGPGRRPNGPGRIAEGKGPSRGGIRIYHARRLVAVGAGVWVVRKLPGSTQGVEPPQRLLHGRGALGPNCNPAIGLRNPNELRWLSRRWSIWKNARVVAVEPVIGRPAGCAVAQSSRLRPVGAKRNNRTVASNRCESGERIRAFGDPEHRARRRSRSWRRRVDLAVGVCGAVRQALNSPGGRPPRRGSRTRWRWSSRRPKRMVRPGTGGLVRGACAGHPARAPPGLAWMTRLNPSCWS